MNYIRRVFGLFWCMLLMSACTSVQSPTQTPPSVATATQQLTERQHHELVIREYYHFVDTEQWGQAYDVLAWQNLPDRATFARDMGRAWESVQVISIKTMEEWAHGSSVQPFIYAVEIDAQWKDGWIPVIPAGRNTQFVRMVKVDGVWKIAEIGSAP